MKRIFWAVLALFVFLFVGDISVFCAEEEESTVDNERVVYVSRTPAPSPNVIAQGSNYDHDNNGETDPVPLIYYGDGSAITVYADMTMLGRVQVKLDQNPSDYDRAGTEGVAGIFYHSNGAKDTLYVACGNEGLQVFDVSAGNKTAPVWKKTRIIYVNELDDIRARAKDVYVSGNYAYVVYKVLTEDGHRTGIQTFKISDDPQNPVLKGECGTPEQFSLGLSGLVEREQGIVVHNGQAYITDYSNGLAVYDVDDPENPTHEAWGLMQYALDVAISDGFVYVAVGGYGLWMLPLVADNNTPDDAIDSEVIRVCQYNEGLTLSSAVEIYGNYAYVADGNAGLVVIDISDPDLINTLNTSITSTDIEALVQQYTPDMSGSYCIHVDPHSGAPVAYIGNRINGLQKIETNGHQDNVSAWHVAGVDATDPTRSPADADAFALDKAFETDKSYAYVVDDDPTINGKNEGFYVYYARLAADWIDFLYKGFLATDGEARDVYVSGDYAYVADGSQGVKVIDPGLPGVDKNGFIKVKEVANPTLKGRCAIGAGNAARIKVAGQYAYVAAEEGGLRVVSIADPAAPVEIGAVGGTDIPDAKSVDVSGDYAYVAGGLNGLQVVDVSRPAAPVLVGRCDLPGRVNDVSLVGERAYVACRSAGEMLVKFDDEDDTLYTYSPVVALDVDSIALDNTNGIAWIGTDGSGVRLFDMNTSSWLRVYNSDHGLTNNDVEAIAIDSNDAVWIGTAGGGISVFDPGDSSWTTYTQSDGLAGDDVEAIAIDTFGNVWVGTDGNGVGMYDLDTVTGANYNAANSGLANDELEGIVFNEMSGNKNAWFATDGGGVSRCELVVPDDDTTWVWTTYDKSVPGIPYNEIEAIAVDSNNNIWIGSEKSTASPIVGGGVSMYNATSGTWTNYDTSDGLCDNRVIAIAVDSSGVDSSGDGDVLWFGTYGGGVSKCELVQWDDDTTWIWTTYNTDNGLADNYIQCIAADAGGNAWFGFTPEAGGLYEVKVADPEQPVWVGDYVNIDTYDVIGIDAAVSDENPDIDLIWTANGEGGLGYFTNPKSVPISQENIYRSSGFVKQVGAFGSFAVLAEGAGGIQVAGVKAPADYDDEAWKNTVPTDLSRGSSSGCFVWSVSSKAVLKAVADVMGRMF